MKLYEINASIDQLMAAIEEHAANNDGVIPDDLDEQLNQLELERNEKIANCARLIKNKLSEAEAIGNEIKRQQERKRMAENCADRVKEYLSTMMQFTEKYSDSAVSISWRKSAKTIIDDLGLVPVEYHKVTIEAKKSDIAAAIKSGKIIPGAHIEECQNIQIK